MSRYATYNTRAIRNQEVLLAALAALGFTNVEVHAEPVVLRDYYGAAGMPAHVVIRKAQLTPLIDSNSYAFVDIGFARQSDGSYAILADDHYPIRLKNGELLTDAVPKAYAQINADKAVRTVLTRTIPGLKARGVIPKNATAVRQTVGNQTRIAVQW